MVHDFSETTLCDAIHFKHKTFIRNDRSNEFVRENYCQTKHSNSWKEKQENKHWTNFFQALAGKELGIQAANWNLGAETISFSFDCFCLFAEVSINTHNLEWIEITPETSEPGEGILKDTR